MFRIYDELYGFVELGFEEKTIIDTPVFQRLRRVKQLGIASLVYPGAEHTRFSHSVGVAYTASLMAERLRRQGYLTGDEVQLVRVAALLHDIGHPPLGHVVEYYYHVLRGRQGGRKLHEDIGLVIVRENPAVREAIGAAGFDAHEVASVLEGSHKNQLLHQIISGDLDADRLDYLPRDALHTGVAYGAIDRDRIIDTLTVDPESGRLALHVKGLQALESFHLARLHMYRAVYHHKTLAAYTLQLARLLALLAEEDPELAPLLSPEGFAKAARGEEIVFYDDVLLLSRIAYAARRGQGEAARLARRFLHRRGPKLVYERAAYVSPGEGGGGELGGLVDSLVDCGVPRSELYVYEARVTVVDESMPIIVVVPGRGSYPATSDELPSVIPRMPRAMVVERIYVEEDYAGAARRCAERLMGGAGGLWRQTPSTPTPPASQHCWQRGSC